LKQPLTIIIIIIVIKSVRISDAITKAEGTTGAIYMVRLMNESVADADLLK